MSKKETSVDRSMVNQRVSKEDIGSEYKYNTKITNYSRTNINESKKSFTIAKLERPSLQPNAMNFELLGKSFKFQTQPEGHKVCVTYSM